MPHTEELINEGFLAESLPYPLADTPTNWATIATGASPRVHGVLSFYIHIPGEPFEVGQIERGRGELTRYCKAECLWVVADRYNIPSLVLDYPVGWPGNMGCGTICLYSWPMPESVPPIISGSEKHFVTTSSKGIELVDGGEIGLYSVKPVLVFDLEIKRGLIEVPAYTRLYAFDPDGSGYRIAIPREKGFEVVGEGRWSEWIYINLKVSERRLGYTKIRSGVVKCMFRVHLDKQTNDGVELTRGEVLSLEGWIDPGGIEEEVLRQTYLSEDEIGLGIPREKLVYDIFGEEDRFLVEQQALALRLAKMVSFFKTRINWRLCFVHFHIVDSVNHRFLGYLHKNSPFYDEDRAEFVWRFYEEAYKIVDYFIGLLVEKVATPNTLIVLVSDHGAVPGWRVVNIRKVFVDEGLLKYEEKITQYLFS